MTDISLLVMAAGMGSRYGGLKQLDAVGPSGETIIDYSVYDAIQAGFNKVVFIIRKDFEDEFKSQITDKYSGKIQVNLRFRIFPICLMDSPFPKDAINPGGPGMRFLPLRT